MSRGSCGPGYGRSPHGCASSARRSCSRHPSATSDREVELVAGDKIRLKRAGWSASTATWLIMPILRSGFSAFSASATHVTGRTGRSMHDEVAAYRFRRHIVEAEAVRRRVDQLAVPTSAAGCASQVGYQNGALRASSGSGRRRRHSRRMMAGERLHHYSPSLSTMIRPLGSMRNNRPHDTPSEKAADEHRERQQVAQRQQYKPVVGSRRIARLRPSPSGTGMTSRETPARSSSIRTGGWRVIYTHASPRNQQANRRHRPHRTRPAQLMAPQAFEAETEVSTMYGAQWPDPIPAPPRRYDGRRPARRTPPRARRCGRDAATRLSRQNTPRCSASPSGALGRNRSCAAPQVATTARQSANRDEARHQPNRRILQRRRYRREMVRIDMHVAVGKDEQVVSCRRQHIQVRDLEIGAAGAGVDDEIDIDLRPIGDQRACHRKRAVVWAAYAKDDLPAGIVLVDKRAQVLEEPGFRAVERLEHRYRRLLRRRDCPAAREPQRGGDGAREVDPDRKKDKQKNDRSHHRAVQRQNAPRA